MDIKNIQPAVNELRKRLVERFGSNIQLYLFGTVVRGDYRTDSDIDILLLLPNELTYPLEEEVFDLAYDVELEYNVLFGISVYSKDFWHSQHARIMPLYEHIQNEGKILL